MMLSREPRLSPVDLVLQDPRTLERDHASRSKNHVGSGLGVPALALFLVLDTKLPEAADDDVLPVGQSLLDEVQHRLDDLK
jgi:hypothetical protein